MTALSVAVASPRKSNAYAKSTEWDFGDIERRRALAGVTQQALCGEALIAGTTYSRIKSGATEPQRRILIRLARALDRLAGDKSPRPEIVYGFYRSAAAIFATELGADVTLALAGVASRSNFDAANARAGKARMLAFYLTVNAYDLPRAATARMVGYSKQAASKALNAIEDQRDDPAFDAMVERVARLLTGKGLA